MNRIDPTRRKIRSLLLVLMGGLCLSAQTQQNLYPANPGGPPHMPPPGKIVLMNPEMSEPIQSLDDLIRMSQLIVDGSIATLFPAINRNPQIVGEVETDSLVSINQVLYGKPPAAAPILLASPGGTQGVWQVSIAGDPLPQSGQRYILFLYADTRKEVPNSAGILPSSSVTPRYFAIGYANGRALVSSGGSVQFLPGAIAALHQYDGTQVTTFFATLGSRVAALFPKASPYPVGVTPLIPPTSSIFPPVPE
jgi:hypothetical protein